VQTSDDRFGEYQGGIGDFGVGSIDAARASLQDLLVEMGTVAQQVYGVVGGIASSLRGSIGESITGLINGTMSWSDALRNIGGSVVQAIIQSFADMAAAWITKQLIMFALGQKLKAADSATTAAKGAADAAAMAPACGYSLHRLVRRGGCDRPGAGARRDGHVRRLRGGGYTGPGGKYAPAGIVHAGEDVFSQANIALWGRGKDGLRNVELLRTMDRTRSRSSPAHWLRTGEGQPPAREPPRVRPRQDRRRQRVPARDPARGAGVAPAEVAASEKRRVEASSSTTSAAATRSCPAPNWRTPSCASSS
jgi:hypothetical protein